MRRLPAAPACALGCAAVVLGKGGGVYIPKPFAVADERESWALIERYSFGTLVTMQDGAPVATHLPFRLDRERGAHGTLVAHMARANAQWRTFGEQEALIIFQGPHSYISPSWYLAQPSVPTWNYAAVHAYGRPAIVEDEQRVLEILRDLVDTYEAGREAPWSLDVLSHEYVARMVNGIVAFEIPITRLEGKRKFNQNRSADDRERVVAALAGSPSELERAAGALMRSLEPGS